MDPKKRPYVGWIPTVSGRLSFRHIGDTRHPTESIFANLDLPDGRIILAYQRRPLSDILFPDIIHPYRGVSGDFWFVLTAESNADPLEADYVSGQVSIFKSKVDWREKADQQVRTHIRNINAQRFSIRPDRVQVARLNFDRAATLVSQTADIRLDFDIHRDGTTYCAPPRFAELALEEASVEFAASEGLDLRKWVTDQCYFFLRDAAHTHQHHEPASDNILILQDNDSDGTEWRKKIIYSLHYAIIRFKRDDLSEQASQRALGILAYCKSFGALCQSHLGKAFEDFPKFNESALELSLVAKSNEITSRLQAIANLQNTRLARASFLRSIALGFFAVIVAIIAILIQPRINDLDKANFPTLYEASTFAANNFFSFIGIGLIVVLVVWVLTHSEWTISTRPGRALLEAAYFRNTSFGIASFVGAAIVVVVSGFLFKSAVIDAVQSLREFISLF